MSIFPGVGTLKKTNIPSAALELIQRAYDAKSSAPDGIVIEAVYQQRVAEVQIVIPARIAFLGGGLTQLMPIFAYGGEKQDMPLEGWKLDFIDFDGTIREASYSAALITLITALNEAERRGAAGLDSNVGVTVAKYDDELQQYSAELYLPIDMTARDSNGEIFAKIDDYVGKVEYADLLEVLPEPQSIEDPEAVPAEVTP